MKPFFQYLSRNQNHDGISLLVIQADKWLLPFITLILTLACAPALSQPTHQIQNLNRFTLEQQLLVAPQVNGRSDTLTQSLESITINEARPFVYTMADRVFIDRDQLPAGSEVMDDKLFKTQVFWRPGQRGDVFFQISILESERIRFDPETLKWLGRVSVKCVAVGRPASELRLVNPLPFVLRANDMQVAVDTFTMLNREKRIEFGLDETEAFYDQLQLSARLQDQTEIFHHTTPVSPYIRISTDKSEIQGMGVDKTEVRVMLAGTRNPDKITVHLWSEKGILQPSEVVLSGEAPSARVTLISQGTGNVKIRPDVPGYVVTSTMVYFTWPWRFLLFAIVGAVGGTFIRLLNKEKGKKPMTRPLVAGTLTGLLVALAYFGLGMNLTMIAFDFSHATEIAVLVLSALGGYLGSLNLKMITKGTGAP